MFARNQPEPSMYTRRRLSLDSAGVTVSLAVVLSIALPLSLSSTALADETDGPDNAGEETDSSGEDETANGEDGEETEPSGDD